MSWKEAAPGASWRTRTGTDTGGALRLHRSVAADRPRAPPRPRRGPTCSTSREWSSSGPTASPTTGCCSSRPPRTRRCLRWSPTTPTTPRRARLRPVLDVRWADPSKDVGKVDVDRRRQPAARQHGQHDRAPADPVGRGIGRARRGERRVQDRRATGRQRRHRAVHRGVGHGVGRLDAAHADHRGDDVRRRHRVRRRRPFTVDNSPPPTNVTITQPAASATVSGNVLVKATASRRPVPSRRWCCRSTAPSSRPRTPLPGT